MVRWVCSARFPCCGRDWSGADLCAVLSVTWAQWITACNWVWLSEGSGLVNETQAVFGNEQAGGERSSAMWPGQHTLMIIHNYFRFWQIVGWFIWSAYAPLTVRFRDVMSCLWCFFSFWKSYFTRIYMKLLLHIKVQFFHKIRLDQNNSWMQYWSWVTSMFFSRFSWFVTFIMV